MMVPPGIRGLSPNLSLGYRFLYEVRWPAAVECLGITLETIGVVAAIHLFTTGIPVRRARLAPEA